MSLIVSEIYDALIEGGTSEEKAKAAAGAIPLAERMATKEDIGNVKQDIARLEMSTKEDFARFEKSTKEDFARLDKKMAVLDKKMAVLNFAVFSFGPALVAMMAKLVFFP